MRETIDLLENLHRERQADGVVEAPQGHKFAPGLVHETESYRFVEPNPAHGTGPNSTRWPGEDYPIYGRERPFLADRIFADPTGYYFVDNTSERCLIVGPDHPDYQYMPTLVKIEPHTDTATDH